jgi:O-antigen ligase
MPSVTFPPLTNVNKSRRAFPLSSLGILRELRIDSVALGAALCCVPLSIAGSESLLAIALAARLSGIALRRAQFHVPRVFWYWLVWAGLETAAWLRSPPLKNGQGEMRHLALLAAMFITLPALNRPGNRLAVWRGIFITASIGSAALVAGFFTRLAHYRHEILVGGDSSLYLRGGGFLHHWMIYAIVEVMVFAALLEYNAAYPEARRWVWPALGINSLAIVLSLTRSLWLGSFLQLGIHLAWRRSKWVWAAPVLPVLAFFLGPAAVRHRVIESFQPDYYSNVERIQMWHVGWKMIRERPLTGVGPGRVEALYTSYLAQGEPVPAYHGHLHNDALQLAAQFGIPVLCAAILCLAILVKDLVKAYRRAMDRESRFLCRAALLGTGAFVFAGATDYVYGHSLGLIMFTFVTLSPLMNGHSRLTVSLNGCNYGHKVASK